jgi:hypothetical protein
MAENWSDAELMASVEAYSAMMRSEIERKPYSKREVYRELAKRFNRSEKAFEYRMQNISAVLNELGREWIPGLKPAGNVGANVKARIMPLLVQWEIRHKTKDRNLASYKAKLPFVREWLIHVAGDKAVVTYGQVMEAFGIDRFSLRHAMDFLGHQADNLDEPIITALIVSKSTGRCSQGFAKEFGVFDDELERQRLYDFWACRDRQDVGVEPPKEDPETKVARFVSVEARPDQAAFRRKVYLACKGKCIISGCDVLKALDAAHKHGRDWRLGHNRAEDGYLLRKDLHALYDNKLLWIDEKGTVELHPSIVEHYGQFNGVAVNP